MLSQVQMGSAVKMDYQPSLTQNKQAMPENTKYNGPGGLEVSGTQNRFAANNSAPLPKPGFNS